MWQWNTDSHQFLQSQKGLQDRNSQSEEAGWATLNGCKCITLHVIEILACQGKSGLLQCLSAGDFTKINIWVCTAAEEGPIFCSRSSALFYIREVTDTESLIRFIRSFAGASDLNKVNLPNSVISQTWGWSWTGVHDVKTSVAAHFGVGLVFFILYWCYKCSWVESSCFDWIY